MAETAMQADMGWIDSITLDTELGIEEEREEDEAQITRPFDPTLIRVENRTLTIDLLLSRIQRGELDLEPDFQRDKDIWTKGARSRLIESILVRIPLPSFYVDATDDDRWMVVDGLQRLSALKAFVLDKTLRLVGLEFLTQMNGKTFDELPRNLQRRIVETQVTVAVIEPGTPPNVKFTIFQRINTGGMPLSRQEIRHALYQGKATQFLARLANASEFIRATANRLANRRMSDQECVLRFLAFTLVNYRSYTRQDFDEFLNLRMVDLNAMDDRLLDELEVRFLRSMEIAYQIFDGRGFRKLDIKTRKPRAISKTLFESWSVSLDQIPVGKEASVIERREEVIDEFILLLGDEDFDKAISLGTNAVSSIHLRFERIERLVQGMLL